MMTSDQPTTTTSSEPGATTRRRAGDASQVLFFGTVAWLGWVWLVATLVYAAVVAAVARWGTVDQSLWQSVASSWQRYVVFAAGVTVSTTFLRMLVRNGATRRILSTGAVVTMSAIAVILTAWNVAGFAVEKVVYDANDWPQALRTDVILTWGDLPRAALENGLIVAAYYSAGWIVGVCYTRWGSIGGTLRLLPGLLPAAAMEFLVTPEFGGMDVDVVADWRDRPHVAVTVVAGISLVIATVSVARRLTRDTDLR